MAHVRGPVNTRKGTAYNVCWRDPDGRFRSERVYGGVRKAEARAKAIDAAKHEGRYYDDRFARRTFQDVAEEWLQTLTRPRPETVDSYRALLRLHAYPAFGSRRVGTIKPGDMGRWINDLKIKPRASRREGTLHPTRSSGLRRCARRIWIRGRPGTHPQGTDREHQTAHRGHDGSRAV